MLILAALSASMPTFSFYINHCKFHWDKGYLNGRKKQYWDSTEQGHSNIELGNHKLLH